MRLFDPRGPAADINCSAWIGKCAARVWRREAAVKDIVLAHIFAERV